jgi:hypothetical protein
LRATEVSDGRERAISCVWQILADSQKAVLGLPQLTGQIRKSLPQLGTQLTGPVPVSGNPELLLKNFFRVQKKFFILLSQFLR